MCAESPQRLCMPQRDIEFFGFPGSTYTVRKRSDFSISFLFQSAIHFAQHATRRNVGAGAEPDGELDVSQPIPPITNCSHFP